jgi:hypothetical protein
MGAGEFIFGEYFRLLKAHYISVLQTIPMKLASWHALCRRTAYQRGTESKVNTGCTAAGSPDTGVSQKIRASGAERKER